LRLAFLALKPASAGFCFAYHSDLNDIPLGFLASVFLHQFPAWLGRAGFTALFCTTSSLRG